MYIPSQQVVIIEEQHSNCPIIDGIIYYDSEYIQPFESDCNKLSGGKTILRAIYFNLRTFLNGQNNLYGIYCNS